MPHAAAFGWPLRGGRGQIDETVVPTLLTANGNLAIVTGDGVIVDYKDTGNFGESIDQLSQAPGLAWMGELRARNDVQWNAVQEAHKSWDYRSQGISPTGAAIISLAAAWATAGMGANLASMVAEGSTAASGMAAGGTLITSSGALTVANGYTVAALNAGFTTLVSQAATAIVGNGGDIGAALKQLGSSNTLKTLATSMVTAGLLASVPMDGLTTPTAGLEGSALKMTDLANKLKVGIAQASISATVDSVINGAPLGDNLKAGLVNAVTSVVGAEVANIIGQQAALAGTDPGNSAAAVKASQLASHAVLGCGMATATGGNCQSGAMGAVIGELAAQAVDEGLLGGAGAAGTSADAQRTTLLAGQIAAVLAAGAMGLDPEAAATTAGNAITNNYLTPKQLVDIEKAKVACNNDFRCVELVIANAQTLSHIQDRDLVFAKIASWFGFDTDLNQLETQLVEAARIENIEAIIRSTYPDLTDAEIQTKSIAYQQEFLASLNESTARIIDGALTLSGAITAGGTVALGKIGVSASIAGTRAAKRPLISNSRANHILHGDATGGGHLWPGSSGKSAFPKDWSADKVLNEIQSIASNTSIPGRVQANGRIAKEITVDGVDIRVVIEPQSKGGSVVTAFPTNLPRTPK